jgi:hypothetical protein
MGMFSKSKYMHRSVRREKVERHVNSNPNTANPGDLPPAPRMPDLPPPPVAPEANKCQMDARDVSNGFPPPAPSRYGDCSGPGGMAAVMGGIYNYFSLKSKEKDCLKEQNEQYQKDLQKYRQLEEKAKIDFEQKSFEYIQYKREHEAQQNRYLDAFEKGRKTLKSDLRCGADTLKHEEKMRDKRERERGRSKTINQPGGTGARNPENDAFPPTGKSPTRAPLPCSDHPYVTDGTPAYHPPNPFEFQWPSQKASMTTQYNQAKASAAPAKNDYWTSYVKEKNTPRYK